MLVNTNFNYGEAKKKKKNQGPHCQSLHDELQLTGLEVVRGSSYQAVRQL